MFENDVKKYGIQTIKATVVKELEFENDVKKYGIQTLPYSPKFPQGFENDVKKYGIQTSTVIEFPSDGLRMM